MTSAVPKALGQVGGCTEDVLKAIQLEGFLFDSSAVPPFLLKDKRKSPILHDWLDQISPEITETTQPYVILEEGHDRLTQQLWEIPDNGCLADYMTGDEIFGHFKGIELLKTRNAWMTLSTYPLAIIRKLLQNT